MNEQRIRIKPRGAKRSIYLPADINERIGDLVSKGAYASEVVTACLQMSLPTVEKQLKKQTAKRNADNR